VILYVVVAIVVLGLIGFIVYRSQSSAPQLPAEEPRQLKKPSKRPAPKDARPKQKKPGKQKTAAKRASPDSGEVEPPVSAQPTSEPLAVDRSPGPPPAPISRRKKDVKGLRRGLAKVREEGGFFGRLKALFAGKQEIDQDIVEELEEILLTSDVGVNTTSALLEDIRQGLESKELGDTDAVWQALQARATEMLDISGGGAIRNHGVPTVVLMIGVNGTGKTTTIGKLATKFVDQGKKVLLVAGDTFRAAAVAQLKAWGERVGCDVYAGEDGADPASVVFDAVKQGTDDGVDLVLVDTAGRLHSKSNLMDELKKVAKTTGKALDGAPHETLLVLDGTTGQNALQQAEEFGKTIELTGIVLTKLDGTAKGGVVLAIAAEQGIPVRYIGVGERAKDLRDFDAEEFVEAMLGRSDDAQQAA
jgi:fused signal recognition particle receptor